jgi:hypothetical protein
MLYIDMKTVVYTENLEIRKKKIISSGLNYNNLGILKLINLSVTLPVTAGEMS